MCDDAYVLTDLFDIDNGELADFSSEECFVLGYELRRVHELVKNEISEKIQIHKNNFERIQRYLIRKDRRFRVLADESKSSGWLILQIADVTGCYDDID